MDLLLYVLLVYVLLGLSIILSITTIVLLIKLKQKGTAENENSLQLPFHQLGQNFDQLNQKLDILFHQQIHADFESLGKQMRDLTESNYKQMLQVQSTLSENTDRQTKRIQDAIHTLQDGNEKKLDEMRKTVDEKLTETLNRRINSSFQTVSEQLSNVYKSLGEMKELSAGVTDNVKGLNRILTNVKVRGTWAELQLEKILDDIIPDMYERNVKTNPQYNGQVEFAIKIPNSENKDIVYLPIDSKFPMEDYSRIAAASENGNLEELARAKKALEARVREEAKAIRNYINAPHTTPFAILYLATEGLYAEITSSPSGIVEKLQSEGIMLAGPSTIIALLNSLSMGFRSIAINRKADEVWRVLGAAKTQYEKFGDLLEKAKKKIEDAGKALDSANNRNRIIQKHLKTVESLDSAEANDLLELDE